MTYSIKSPLTKTSGHYTAEQLWTAFAPMTPASQQDRARRLHGAARQDDLASATRLLRLAVHAVGDADAALALEVRPRPAAAVAHAQPHPWFGRRGQLW